jgi:hypothetical protein
MSIVDNREIQVGEVTEAFDSRWCPYCHAVQMDIVAAFPAGIANAVKVSKIVWRCPKCYKKIDT